ncbi:MAG: hypothetical protein HC933_09165 [Pleurocapsa sp. SU_196_0]|nr:hypothetical protein [Pleurocapsa sp. SU_196_0]
MLGRTFAERAAGSPFGLWVAGDEEVFLLAFELRDATACNDVDLYRTGSVVYENLLPAASQLAPQLAVIRAVYATTRGRS